MYKLGKYYSEHASFFGWGQNSAKLDQERLDLINRFLMGKKILDVGCSVGLYVDYLASLGYDSFGIDVAEQFIKSAKKEKRGTFVRGNAEKIPFKSNFFDTVLLFDIIEHGDDLKILKEVKRVTKKRILVVVPRVVDKLLSDTGVIFRHYLDKTHLREYRHEDFKRLANQSGLKLIHIQPVHKLNNKIIFISLFKGPTILRDIIRKLVYFVLPGQDYYTEYFAVFEKK